MDSEVVVHGVIFHAVHDGLHAFMRQILFNVHVGGCGGGALARCTLLTLRELRPSGIATAKLEYIFVASFLLVTVADLTLLVIISVHDAHFECI